MEISIDSASQSNRNRNIGNSVCIDKDITNFSVVENNEYFSKKVIEVVPHKIVEYKITDSIKCLKIGNIFSISSNGKIISVIGPKCETSILIFKFRFEINLYYTSTKLFRIFNEFYSN